MSAAPLKQKAENLGWAVAGASKRLGGGWRKTFVGQWLVHRKRGWCVEHLAWAVAGASKTLVRQWLVKTFVGGVAGAAKTRVGTVGFLSRATILEGLSSRVVSIG